jgi:hypothetical protein
MSNKKDTSVPLEEARQEPRNESPDRGFVATSDNEETVQLGEKPQVTKDVK